MDLLGHVEYVDPYVKLLKEELATNPRAEPSARIAYAEARTYMHDLLLRDTDQMSMAHALEVRVPLLDHRLASYAMGVPDEDRRGNGVVKPLLVDSVRDLLPEEIARRRKQGFVLPLDAWMRGPLAGFCESRLARLDQRGIFRSGVIPGYWNKFSGRQRDAVWSRLWALVALDEWLDLNPLDV